MLNWLIFWPVAIVVVIGHLLLLRSAWRFRHSPGDLPAGVPRSNPYGDVAWTLVTAVVTLIILGFVFLALP